MEGYGLDELAASAERVLAGLGPLASGLARLAAEAGPGMPVTPATAGEKHSVIMESGMITEPLPRHSPRSRLVRWIWEFIAENEDGFGNPSHPGRTQGR